MLLSFVPSYHREWAMRSLNEKQKLSGWDPIQEQD